MNKMNRAETDNKLDITFRKITETLMTIYVLFYLCIFPLATHNKYYDILTFRFKLFWMPTLGIGIVFILLGAIYIIQKKQNLSFSQIRNFYLSFTFTDKCFTLLLLEMILSTVYAPYIYEAFWGSRGRYMGLFIWIFFYIAYILITRFYKTKKWHLYLALIASLVPCIWGICNFFMLDPFGFLDDVQPAYVHIFASSFGNINTYSNYVGMVLAVSVTVFTLTDDRALTVVSAVAVIIHAFALVMSISDNAILSAAAIYITIPFLSWKDDGEFIKYWVSVFIFFFSVILSGIFSDFVEDTMNFENDSIMIAVGKTAAFRMVTGILGVAILLYLIKRKNQQIIFSQQIYLGLRKIWKYFWIFVFVGIIAILAFVNIRGIPETLKQYQNIFVFNDDWGTGRGLCWRLGREYFINDSTLFQKLFGNGPDTYFILMMDRYRKIMENSPYGVYDSAHNEYLEYLTTIGIFGLILYVMVLFNTIKTGISKKSVLMTASAIAVLAYAAQATVNIAIPISVPIFIIFIAISNCQST